MNNYYARYPTNYGQPYIPPPQPPQPMQQNMMDNQNGMQVMSNCDFIKVSGPKQVEEFVVNGGYTVYFLDNNKPIMYVKKASEFGPTNTRYYRIDEIDKNELKHIMNEDEVTSEESKLSSENDNLRAEVDSLKSQLNDQKNSIINILNTLNGNCHDIQNIQDMISKNNMRDRRDSYESTYRKPRTDSSGKQSDERHAKSSSEQSKSNRNDENNGD